MVDNVEKYLIETFLKVTKQDKSIQQVLNTTYSILRTGYPGITEEQYENIIKKYDKDKYINEILPIINEQFNKDELKELISFFSSSLGKKFLSNEYNKKINLIGKRLYSNVQNELGIIENDKN